jgi:hypothetical protein
MEGVAAFDKRVCPDRNPVATARNASEQNTASFPDAINDLLESLACEGFASDV